jgi:hypothetical protein
MTPRWKRRTARCGLPTPSAARRLIYSDTITPKAVSTTTSSRIERCYAAKTRGELDALTIDLPRAEHQQLPGPPRQRRPPRPLATFVAIAALVAVALTTDAQVLWLLLPLAFFGFGRFRRGRGCGSTEYSRAASWKRSP